MQKTRFRALLAGLIVAAMSLFVGCGGDNPSRPADNRAAASDGAASPNRNPSGMEAPPIKETKPKGPQIADPGDVPTNIPKGIPTPEPPIKPGEMKVKATSFSISSYPLNPFGRFNRLINIHVDLKWQLYPGAVSYRVSRSGDGTDNFQVKATIPANRLNKILPLFWREYSIPGSGALVPGQAYKYMVDALNTSNRVVASGTEETTPLYPLDIPKQVSPDNNAKGGGIQPRLQWEKVNNADGYFVEVFSGVTFNPQWRAFRSAETIMYGELGDKYPGTAPAIWTTVLAVGKPVTWTVTAYKSDSGNASTAKAFAHSNAPSWIYTP